MGKSRGRGGKGRGRGRPSAGKDGEDSSDEEVEDQRKVGKPSWLVIKTRDLMIILRSYIAISCPDICYGSFLLQGLIINDFGF